MKKIMKSKTKIIMLVVLSQLLITVVNAENVSISKAERVAENKCKQDTRTGYDIKSTYVIYNENNIPLFYVFSLNPKGYIIVSADTDLPPVIAYSYTNDLDTEGFFLEFIKTDLELRSKNLTNIPESVISMRHQQWSELLDFETKSTKDILFQQWPPAGTTTTGGWLKTNGHQNSPYNALCPLDGGGIRSIVGCPATAMAQILNFHKTTNNTTFTDADDYYHNYGSGNKYWIDNDYTTRGFPSFSQLNGYLATLQQHYDNNTTLTNTDKAALSFACGVAATQVYSSNGSGTFGVIQAYNAYQKFNCTTIELLYDSDTSLFTRLTQNMKDTLPAHLAVVNADWSMGHNVVVDGYNTDNYYHINWGWGGTYNGWYLLPDEIPYGLTVIEGLIIDIMKNNSTTIERIENAPLSLRIYPNPTSTSTTIQFPNPENEKHTLTIYNTTGQMVQTIENITSTEVKVENKNWD
ncbi:MAG: hypothetical protein CVT95_11150, partial [Bacteroidetes bacterium HGW-Bacteroidetes-12]